MKNGKNGNEKKTVAINRIKLIFAILSLVTAAVFLVRGIMQTNDKSRVFAFAGTAHFERVTEALEEDYSDETICPVEYESEDGEYTCSVDYTYEQWEELPGGDSFEGYIYTAPDGSYAAFNHEASVEELERTAMDMNADDASDLFGTAMALFFVSAGLFIVYIWRKFFTAYEQIWFISILVLASIFSIIFPEEDCNGINAIIIMGLYLADTFLNVLCELLISKQSKWNFIVSVFVEITEIAICIVLAYRFATLASTLFFWLPCDIISFINWHRHPDRKDDELTEVRTLTGWQEGLVVTGIFVWTIVVGYFLTTIDIGTDLFGGNETLETIVCYLDACVSAVGIANGLFILFRYREQWIAWYISALIETAINIISGQYVLLVLKVGYLTNTTYGYIKWTQYIKQVKEEKQKKEEAALV